MVGSRSIVGPSQIGRCRERRPGVSLEAARRTQVADFRSRRSAEHLRWKVDSLGRGLLNSDYLWRGYKTRWRSTPAPRASDDARMVIPSTIPDQRKCPDWRNSTNGPASGREPRRPFPQVVADIAPPGGDRDHRGPDRPALAGRAGGPRGGPAEPVRQQPEAAGTRLRRTTRRERRLPAGLVQMPAPATRARPATAGTSTASCSACCPFIEQRQRLQRVQRQRPLLPRPTTSTVQATGPQHPLVPERRRRSPASTILAGSTDGSTTARSRCTTTATGGTPGTWFSPGRYQDPNCERPGPRPCSCARPTGMFYFDSAVDDRRRSPTARATRSLLGERRLRHARAGDDAGLTGTGGPRGNYGDTDVHARSTRSTRQQGSPDRRPRPAAINPDVDTSRRPRASTPAGPTSPSATARSGSSRTRSTPGRSTRPPGYPIGVPPRRPASTPSPPAPSSASTRPSRPATAARSSAPTRIDRSGGILGDGRGAGELFARRIAFRNVDDGEIDLLDRVAVVDRERSAGADAARRRPGRPWSARRS